jgi:hypothetical protein
VYDLEFVYEDLFNRLEKVLSHRFIPKARNANNLQLLIKWENYETPDWNLYSDSSIKKVEKVHDYLYEKQLQEFVPQQFKRSIKTRREQILNNLQNTNSIHYFRRLKKKQKSI